MEMEQSIQHTLDQIKDLLSLDDRLDEIMEKHAPDEEVTDEKRMMIRELNGAISKTVLSLRVALLKTLTQDLLETMEKLENNCDVEEKPQ